MRTARPAVLETLTFFGEKAFRRASAICAAHIPHIMPSICRVIFVMTLFLLPVAGPRHRAVGTVTAAGGFSFLFIPDKRPDGQSDHGEENNTDDDRPDVVCDPCKHSGLLSLYPPAGSPRGTGGRAGMIRPASFFSFL